MTGYDELAVLVQRLAVLTSAGIPAASAWRHVADAAPDGPAAGVARGLEAAHDIPARITASAGESSALRVLAAVWGVAAEAGAALAPALERTAGVLRDLGRGEREVEVALAGPAATSRVVLALPALAVLLGVLLGFDMAGAFASLPGLVCLALAGALVAVAVRWNRRLLHWAREHDASSGLGCELYAIALSGGMSIERAGHLVERCCREAGLAPADDTGAVLAFARRAGVPVVALLRAEADAARHHARTAAAERAVRLETRLLLPLGLCVLPAFVLAGVVPMGLAILSSTAVGV
ncbi:MAG TPA: type II secretion system F family protein [Pseudolysinimonas sp.]|nr:type II secretion system F family protein [Pseudolysinimonas sp.]